jgi:hypothetical protein
MCRNIGYAQWNIAEDGEQHRMVVLDGVSESDAYTGISISTNCKHM